MGYWVYAEDLVSALIGPFDNRAEAEAHVEFCAERGDASEAEGNTRILTDEEVAPLRGTVGMIMTPDEDRNYDPSDNDDPEGPWGGGFAPNH